MSTLREEIAECPGRQDVEVGPEGLDATAVEEEAEQSRRQKRATRM